MAEGGAPAVGDDGVFEIDRVVDIMWINEEDDAPQYRVRWKGFPPIEDTWEPIENFTSETRRTVRDFVRRYTRLQIKESRFQREIGQGNGKPCRHVNILSREVLSISSMRCDTTRQPPLWFYLVVWRNERPEDATWESAVYLRHASDLIHQYRAKHPTSPNTTQDCASKSPRSLVPPATTSQKLFLDGPAPRKQKEKLAFVDNLIDDSISLGQAKCSKGRKQSKHKQELSSNAQIKKLDGEGFWKSKNISKGVEAIKHPPPKSIKTNTQISNNEQLSNDSFANGVNKTKGADHAKIGKSHLESSHHTKPQTGTRRGTQDDTDCDTEDEILPKGKLLTGAKESPITKRSTSCSGDRFKRIFIETDTSESSDNDSSNDNINFYKNKFIKDEKLEEKKRRIWLMENRKKASAEKSTKKTQTLKVSGKSETRGSKEKSYSERPFSEKRQLFVTKLSNNTPEIDENESQPVKVKPQAPVDYKVNANYSKSKNETKSGYSENHAAHRRRILEKFGNIFGYDTDSEDITLSPQSHSSFMEKDSFLNKGSISSPDSRVSNRSYMHCNEDCSKDISRTTKAIDPSASSSSCSSNNSSRRHRSSAGNNKSSHHKRHDKFTNCSGDKCNTDKPSSDQFGSCLLHSSKENDLQLYSKEEISSQSPSFLSELEEYAPLSSREMSIQPQRVPHPDGDNILTAVNLGDCDTLIELLSVPDLCLPSLQFPNLLIEAIHAGHSGVAQVLAALCWGVNSPASHNKDQWERVVVTAAAQGDLSLLLVLSTLSETLLNSTTCASSSLAHSLQQCAQGGAQRCAQRHILAALNTSCLTF